MSTSTSDPLADRYGRARPARRRTVVLASGLVGVLALAWVVWAAWIQSTPEVQSVMRSYRVVDAHRVSAEVTVKPASRDVVASCLVRAFGVDHSVVGERNVRVAGEGGAVRLTVPVRTEREATAVELVGCTTPHQKRPR